MPSNGRIKKYFMGGARRARATHRIRQRFLAGEYEVTIPHFFEEMVNDNLSLRDIRNAILNGRVRRRFTHDPRGTRYEVVGEATDGRSIAIICRFKATGKLLLITTYALEYRTLK